MDISENQKNAAISLAKEFGSHALSATKDLSATVQDYVQRGPEGIGWLCFVGGLATSVLAFLGVLNVLDAGLEPLQYLLNIYQMAFGFTVCVIEAPLEWVEKSAKLSKARSFIHEFAKFLETFGGRGLFYIFQGSIDVSLNSFSLTTLVGCYMCGAGLLCIGMQFGLKPDLSFASATRHPGRADDYIHVT
eukprot:TRINITY_DN81590_c0_g1_i1.p1 TRINITY_DN81590_c0_g1~~TRINITY_DN81590_c0_g1_i1.p1  ORF type:complete len:190 (-),score=38.90 TRINITY_DN81590_c0_g1_i1:73-642(-)